MSESIKANRATDEINKSIVYSYVLPKECFFPSNFTPREVFGDLRDFYFSILQQVQFKNNKNELAEDRYAYLLGMFYAWAKSEFKSLKFRAPSGRKEMFSLELKLWKSIISVAERLRTYKQWERDAIETLLLIIEENALVCLPFGDSEYHFDTMTQMIRTYQKENNLLLINDFDDDDNPNNPFNAKTRPVTFSFINCAMKFAYQADDFRKQTYLPMVRNRRAFCSFIRRGGYALGKIDRIVKRGRTS